MLWSKGLLAQYKIKEIEEGIPIEKSEVIEGTEDVSSTNSSRAFPK